MIENSLAKSEVPYEKVLLTPFDTQLYCHAIAFVRKEVGRIDISLSVNVVNSTVVGMVAQLEWKA